MKINSYYNSNHSGDLSCIVNKNTKSIICSESFTQRLPITGKKLVEINRSSEGTTSAYILDLSNNSKEEIRSEYLPKELSYAKDTCELRQYLNSVWVKSTEVNGNEHKIEMIPRLLGGMKNDNDDIDEFFNTAKRKVKQLDETSRKKVTEELRKAQKGFEEAEQRGVSSKEVSESIMDRVVGAIKYVAKAFSDWLEYKWDKFTSYCAIF